MRMAADNQAFLARLCSTQLPQAATEAILAAAAAAGFPLHQPTAGVQAAGAGMPGGAAQAGPLAMPRSSSASSLPQQAQQAALAAAQQRQQQQQALNSDMGMLQAQQAQQAQQQGAYSAALLQQQQAADLLALQSQDVQQGACAAGATDGTEGGSKRSLPAGATQPPASAGAADAGPSRVSRSAPASPQQPVHLSSTSRFAAGPPQPPPRQQQQQQRPQPADGTGGAADGWQGARPTLAFPAATTLAASGMATAPPNTPVAAAAGRLSTPQLAINAQLAMLRQGAGCCALLTPCFPSPHTAAMHASASSPLASLPCREG